MAVSLDSNIHNNLANELIKKFNDNPRDGNASLMFKRKSKMTYKSGRRGPGGGPARGILDGDLVTLYGGMPRAERQDIAKKIGTKVEEIIADLYEIDRLTAHF